MFSDTTGNILSIKVLTGHNNDPALPPVPGSREDSPMPKSKNSPFARPINRFQVLVSATLPTQASSDQTNEPRAYLSNQEGLYSLPGRKSARAAPIGNIGEDFGRSFRLGTMRHFHQMLMDEK